MKIEFNVDDDYIKNLQIKLKRNDTKQIMAESLSLFNWAVGEVMDGKKIVSLDEKNEVYKEVTTCLLQKVDVK